MLTKINGAVVGDAPTSETELDMWLQLWVDPTTRRDTEYGVTWLADVARISYLAALATLYERDPLGYQSLAHQAVGNIYTTCMPQHAVNLLDVLRAAAEVT